MAIFNTILGLFIGVLVLSFLVTIHEFGHFIIAKIVGAYVCEFSIGFGPKIITWGKSETKYSIRIFPFGGYVYIASKFMNLLKIKKENIIIPDDRMLENLKKWKNLLIVFFGPFVNFVFALFLLAISFSIIGYNPKDVEYWGADYCKDGVAYKALSAMNPYFYKQSVILDYWLGNDKEKLYLAAKYYKNNNRDDPDFRGVVSHLGEFNNIPSFLATFNDFTLNLKKQFLIDKNNNNSISYIIFNFVIVDRHKKVIRNSMLTNVVKLKKSSTTYSIGILPPTRFFDSSWDGFKYGCKKIFSDVINVLKSLSLFFCSRKSSLLSVKFIGPVGIASIVNLVLFDGLLSFILYVSSLSVGLFVMNLMFIPPLDGYKFFEIIIEMIVNFILKIRLMFCFKKNILNKDRDKDGVFILDKSDTKQFNNWCFPYEWKKNINIIGSMLLMFLLVFITISDILNIIY